MSARCPIGLNLRSRDRGHRGTAGAPELRLLIMSPGLDVGASLRERPIMPAPRRAQGGWMNGARRTERRRAGPAPPGRVLGGGPGGTQREGRPLPS